MNPLVAMGLIRMKLVTKHGTKHRFNLMINLISKFNGFYGCLDFIDKYYGHQHHELCFAAEKLKKWNADVLAGGRRDLVDYYT